MSYPLFVVVFVIALAVAGCVAGYLWEGYDDSEV